MRKRNGKVLMEPLLEGALTIRGRHEKVNHNEAVIFYHKEVNRITVFSWYNSIQGKV